MDRRKELFRIKKKKVLSPTVFQLKVVAPTIARKRKPGQFIILRVHEEGERIPLTIVDSDPEEGTITLIVQEVGKTTALLGTLKEGDSILDVVGPLGKPTHIKNFGTAVVVGGGIGIAPVYPIAKGLKEAGNRVVAILGARNRSLLILEKEMRGVSDEIYITTDDGSYGRKGFVTEMLDELIKDGLEAGMVLGIGPLPMMKALCEVTRPHGIYTVVSLNPIMVDGTGMCGACRITFDGKTRFVCVDGPEFDGHKVDFDELIRRNRTYLKEERIAMEAFTYHEGPRCYETPGE